jgi:hypothetical protein
MLTAGIEAQPAPMDKPSPFARGGCPPEQVSELNNLSLKTR